MRTASNGHGAHVNHNWRSIMGLEKDQNTSMKSSLYFSLNVEILMKGSWWSKASFKINGFFTSSPIYLILCSIATTPLKLYSMSLFRWLREIFWKTIAIIEKEKKKWTRKHAAHKIFVFNLSKQYLCSMRLNKMSHQRQKSSISRP